MEPFDFKTPSTSADAIAAQQIAEDGLYLAGGQTMIPVMKQGLAMPSDVISLAGVTELVGIEKTADGLVVGSMTRHAAVASSDVVASSIPILGSLAGGIGDPQVRNQGTIGGSLANNDPSADYPAAVLGLGATVITVKREIAAEDYFQGMFETALDDGELITQVRFPIPSRAGYAKFPNPASRYALVGAFVAETPQGVRVAITGAGQEGVFRWGRAEEALAGTFSAAALEGLALPGDDMISDMHGDGAYRAHLASVMTKRAVEAAVG